VKDARSAGEVDRHQFNDDLLTGQADQAAARAAYPGAAFALLDVYFLETFRDIDFAAQKWKRRSRAIGLSILLVGAAGWIVGAAQPLFGGIDQHTSLRALAVFGQPLLTVSALCGVASVVAALWAMRASSSRMKWLRARFLSERLRQFHFQDLILHLHQLALAIQDPSRRTEFLASRRGRLEVFKQRFLGHAQAELDLCLEDEDAAQTWLGPLSEPELPIEYETLAEFFSAYRDLRITHQINYATYMLRSPRTAFDMPLRLQDRLLRTTTFAAIAFMFLANFGQALHFPLMTGTLGYVVMIWIAIAGLMVRALEEGLQPQREIERCESFRASCIQKREQFDQARTPAEKYAVMLAVERATYDEMRLFLKNNASAKFLV